LKAGWRQSDAFLAATLAVPRLRLVRSDSCNWPPGCVLPLPRRDSREAHRLACRRASLPLLCLAAAGAGAARGCECGGYGDFPCPGPAVGARSIARSGSCVAVAGAAPRPGRPGPERRLAARRRSGVRPACASGAGGRDQPLLLRTPQAHAQGLLSWPLWRHPLCRLGLAGLAPAPSRPGGLSCAEQLSATGRSAWPAIGGAAWAAGWGLWGWALPAEGCGTAAQARHSGPCIPARDSALGPAPGYGRWWPGQPPFGGRQRLASTGGGGFGLRFRAPTWLAAEPPTASATSSRLAQA